MPASCDRRAAAAEYGCEQWKPISEAMGMKNRREALIEFLRLKIGKDNKSGHLQDLDEVERIEALEKEYMNIFANKTEHVKDEAYKT